MGISLTYSFVITEKQKNFLIKLLEKYCVPLSTPYQIYHYKYKNTTISIYRNNKIVIQGSGAQTFYEEHFEKAKAQNKSAWLSEHLGADEVGVGDYFGPVVSAAVYVTKDSAKKLNAIGVKDSKKLNDLEMIKMAEVIKSITPSKISICLPKQYNALIDKKLTSHHVKTYCHNIAISALLEEIKIKPPIILDQYCTKEKYLKYSSELNQEPAPINIFIHQAESHYIAVAAASILARVTFVELMSKMSNELKCKIPLGATKVIDQARFIYKKIGQEKFKNLVKWHFKTTEKVIA